MGWKMFVCCKTEAPRRDSYMANCDPFVFLSLKDDVKMGMYLLRMGYEMKLHWYTIVNTEAPTTVVGTKPNYWSQVSTLCRLTLSVSPHKNGKKCLWPRLCA